MIIHMQTQQEHVPKFGFYSNFPDWYLMRIYNTNLRRLQVMDFLQDLL
jgi:hypothetical protein